jgi:hypothetical protein
MTLPRNLSDRPREHTIFRFSAPSPIFACSGALSPMMRPQTRRASDPTFNLLSPDNEIEGKPRRFARIPGQDAYSVRSISP